MNWDWGQVDQNTGEIRKWRGRKGFKHLGIDYGPSAYDGYNAAQLADFNVYPVQRAARPNGTYYNWTATYELDEPNGVIQEVIATTPRPVEHVRTYWKDRVKAKRDSIIAEGFVWYESRFDIDLESRANITGELEALGRNPAPPSTIDWIDYHNQLAIFTAEDFEEFALDMKEYVSDVYMAKAAHDVIIGQTNFDDLLEYDIETGWPSN